MFPFLFCKVYMLLVVTIQGVFAPAAGYGIIESNGLRKMHENPLIISRRLISRCSQDTTADL